MLSNKTFVITRHEKMFYAKFNFDQGKASVKNALWWHFYIKGNLAKSYYEVFGMNRNTGRKKNEFNQYPQPLI